MNPPPLEIPGEANRVPAAGRKLVAGIFLMINSLDSGGSERQFAALARSLDPDSFCLYLGCIQKRGAFLDGLPEMAQFPLDGSLYGLHADSGTPAWHVRAGGAVDGGPVQNGAAVYAGNADGILLSVETDTGDENWRFAAGQ